MPNGKPTGQQIFVPKQYWKRAEIEEIAPVVVKLRSGHTRRLSPLDTVKNFIPWGFYSVCENKSSINCKMFFLSREAIIPITGDDKDVIGYYMDPPS